MDCSVKSETGLRKYFQLIRKYQFLCKLAFDLNSCTYVMFFILQPSFFSWFWTSSLTLLTEIWLILNWLFLPLCKQLLMPTTSDLCMKGSRAGSDSWTRQQKHFTITSPFLSLGVSLNEIAATAPPTTNNMVLNCLTRWVSTVCRALNEEILSYF